MDPSRKRRRRKKKHAPSSSLPTAAAASAVAGADAAKEEDEADAIRWLSDAFDSISLDHITSAYHQSGRDAFKASGILSAVLVDPDNAPRPGYKKGSASQRHKKPIASTGVVSSVIGKEYSGRKALAACGAARREDMDKGPGPMLYSEEEAEDLLCFMLGDGSDLSLAVVRDVLCQFDYDVAKAMDAFLSISDISCSRALERSSYDDKKCIAEYSCHFPDLPQPQQNVSSNKELRKLPSMTHHVSGKEHEFLQSVEHSGRDYSNAFVGSVEPPPPMPGIMKSDLQQKVLKCLFNVPDTSKLEPKRMNWKKVVEKAESFGQGLELCIPSDTQELQNDRNDIYQVFHRTAKKHWDTMKTYYQRAAIAYAKGERAHAFCLSEQGRYFRNMARVEDEKACWDIFDAKNKDVKNAITIDLHGQHVAQAIGILKRHLVLFTYIPSVHLLKVITGCSSNGVGKGKLKRMVLSLAEKEGIEWYEENPGILVLQVDRTKQYSFMNSQSDSE